MNTKTTETPLTASPETPVPVRARRAPSFTGGLALILALISLVASAYLWYGLGEKQGLFGSNIVGKVDELAASIQALDARNGELAQQMAQVRETQETIKSGMDRMAADLAGNRKDWLIAEAEQLLVIAEHRLQLGQDIPLALTALRSADNQIMRLASPGLLPVRKQIAHDIGQLEAINQIDFDGIALQIGNLAERVDTLPLAVETTFKSDAAASGPVADGNAWTRLWREIWHDLKNLVRIRHDAEKRRPLLPPEQQYFLRENLRLMLYGSQLALMRRDEGTYEQNLRAAQNWLKDYFDLGAPAVARTIEEIGRLTGNRMTVNVPDISGSLQALQRATGRTASQP